MLKKLCFFLFSFATLPLLAQDETPTETVSRNQRGSLLQTLLMIAIAIAFFYLILWRPEQKRRKALEEKRSSMKKGDRVTAMGIVGTIDQIKDQTVILKMVDGSKIEFIKGAVTEVHSRDSSTNETPET